MKCLQTLARLLGCFAIGLASHTAALADSAWPTKGPIKLAAQGFAINTGTPQAAQAFIEGQMDVWAKVVKANGIKPD